jgi:hypothetical protein
MTAFLILMSSMGFLSVLSRGRRPAGFDKDGNQIDPFLEGEEIRRLTNGDRDE